MENLTRWSATTVAVGLIAACAAPTPNPSLTVKSNSQIKEEQICTDAPSVCVDGQLQAKYRGPAYVIILPVTLNLRSFNCSDFAQGHLRIQTHGKNVGVNPNPTDVDVPFRCTFTSSAGDEIVNNPIAAGA